MVRFCYSLGALLCLVLLRSDAFSPGIGIVPARLQLLRNVQPVPPLFVASLDERPRAPREKDKKPSNSNQGDLAAGQKKVTIKPASLDRFHRTSACEAFTETPIILTIHDKQYNMTAWAKSHPGGVSVLEKFHDKDATLAFEKSGHSAFAYELLKEFEIPGDRPESVTGGKDTQGKNVISQERSIPVPTWRKKLFTKEDPIGVHKFLGVYALIHFSYRIGQMLFYDPSSGLGTKCGSQASARLLPMLFILPHGMLSLSSLIFHTVPRERVVGKPMIWQEFRAHNIIFGLRSVICTTLAWSPYYFPDNRLVRRIAVIGSGAAILASNALADEATARFRENSLESTTATMPYWEGCSIETQRRFKSFYAYSQFMATIACLAVGNPAWPFSVLLAIQLSSLLMTLVRKSLISTKQYHLVYTSALIIPYFVALRGMLHMKPFEVPALFFLGGILYQLRRRGVNKFALWSPVVLLRIALGDKYLSWNVW